MCRDNKYVKKYDKHIVMSSSSSSDDDDEEFSVLSLLLDGKDRSDRSIPQPREVSPAAITSNSEFEVNLPSIFLYDAKRNEQLDKNNQRLEDAMVQEELRILEDFHDLVRKKQRLLQELNDNGLAGLKTFHIDHDKMLIERYVRAIYDNTTISRHFYFFNNVYEVNCETLAKYPTSHFFYELLSTRFTSNWDRIRRDPLQFLHHCLKDKNIDHLKQADKFFTRAIEHEDSKKTIGIDAKPTASDLEGSFLSTLSKIGASITGVNGASLNSTIPIKLYQFNNHSSLNIIRSSLIIKTFMVYPFSLPQMIKVFLLVVSDFNLNKFATKDLETFTQNIFTLLVSQSGLSSEGFVRQFNTILNNSLDVHIIYQPPSQFKKHAFELRYNVIRWLNVAFSNCPDRTILAIIASINFSFLTEKDYLVTVSNILLTPSLAFLKSLFHDIAATKVVEGLESNDFTIINQFYHDYYKIALLHFVCLDSFDTFQDEKARVANVKHLQKKIVLISNLKDILHANIGKVSYTYTEKDTVVNRLEIAKHITESFYTLNHLYNQAENDLSLIKDDIFYSDI